MSTRLVVFVLFVLSSAIPVWGREWKDASGAFKIEAEYIATKNGKVYLEKPDGAVIKIALDKLSPADRDFVRSQTAAAPAAAAPTAPAAPMPAANGADDRTTIVKIKDSSEEKPGLVRSFGGEGWGIGSLAFAPSGGRLAVGKNDEAIALFDVNTSDQLAFHDKLSSLGQVKRMAFTPDGKYLLTGGYKGRIQLWEVSRDGVLLPRGNFPGHSGEIKSIAVSKDSKFVLSGGADKRARFWKIDGFKEIHTFEGCPDVVQATWISADAKLGVICDGKKAILYDLESGKSKGEMSVGRGASQFVAISPDGSRIAVTDTYAIRCWDSRTGKETALMQAQEIQWAGDFSPDGRYLASGGSGVCNIWEVKTGRKVHSFELKNGYTQTVIFSPDNLHIAATTQPLGSEIQLLRLPKLDP